MNWFLNQKPLCIWKFLLMIENVYYISNEGSYQKNEVSKIPVTEEPDLIVHSVPMFFNPMPLLLLNFALRSRKV